MFGVVHRHLFVDLRRGADADHLQAAAGMDDAGPRRDEGRGKGGGDGADLEGLGRWSPGSSCARRIFPDARRSTSMARAASASPRCRIAARCCACRPASMGGSRTDPEGAVGGRFREGAGRGRRDRDPAGGHRRGAAPAAGRAAPAACARPASPPKPMSTGAAVRTFNVLLAEDRRGRRGADRGVMPCRATIAQRRRAAARGRPRPLSVGAVCAGREARPPFRALRLQRRNRRYPRPREPAAAG